jgi:hypothetical protein
MRTIFVMHLRHEPNRFHQLARGLFRLAESMAREESQTMRELFGKAFRVYRIEPIRKRLREDQEYSRSLPPAKYTDADVDQRGQGGAPEG